MQIKSTTRIKNDSLGMATLNETKSLNISKDNDGMKRLTNF